MKIPQSMQSTLAWFAGPLALLLVATAGSLVGSGQQKVPFEGGIPIAPLNRLQDLFVMKLTPLRAAIYREDPAALLAQQANDRVEQ